MTHRSTTARVWQYSQTTNGVENHLELKSQPIPEPNRNQHLIRIIKSTLNAADYKFAETPFIGSLLVRKPACPGLDVAGEIVIPASGSPFQKGQLVFGQPDRGLIAKGGLAEYSTATKDDVVAIPDGVSISDAVALPVAAVTAYQTITSTRLREGDWILYNGGAGGVGTMAIQIAKLLGYNIAVTCSTRNVDLCKGLGADEVIDYTRSNIIEQLSSLSHKFDLVIDGVGNDHDLYWKCDRFTNSGASFLTIGISMGLRDVGFMLLSNVLPLSLGGQSRKLVPFATKVNAEDMQRVVTWVAEGKLKVIIDSRYSMRQVPEAMRRLKEGRSRGKIVIDVAEDSLP